MMNKTLLWTTLHCWALEAQPGPGDLVEVEEIEEPDRALDRGAFTTVRWIGTFLGNTPEGPVFFRDGEPWQAGHYARGGVTILSRFQDAL